MGITKQEYRVTLPGRYNTEDCPGKDDVTSRQGYYVYAPSAVLAAMRVRAEGQSSYAFDVQPWRDATGEPLPNALRKPVRVYVDYEPPKPATYTASIYSGDDKSEWTFKADDVHQQNLLAIGLCAECDKALSKEEQEEGQEICEACDAR